MDVEGLDWRKALSDDNSGYIEIQAGLFRNQETYAFLEPRQAIHFSEYWMPVRALDGISRANLTGVVSLARHDNTFVAGFNANRVLLRTLRLRYSTNSRSVFSRTLDLQTRDHTGHINSRSKTPTAEYTIEIRDASGNLIFARLKDEYDWTPESEIQVGPQANSEFPTLTGDLATIGFSLAKTPS